MVAIATVFFTSCSKDDDATVNPDGKKLVSKISLSSKDADNELEDGDITFQYDKNGTIEKIVSKGREVYDSYDDEWTSTYVFSYSGNKITSKYDYTTTDNKTGETETGTYTTEYTLNDEGYISQFEQTDDGERKICKYSYDDEGQLVKREDDYGVTTYGWSNGNLVSERRSGSSNVISYTYTNEENKANIDFGFLLNQIGPDDGLSMFGYLGKTNKNCLNKESRSDYSTTYKYTFNGDGYVTKIQGYDKNELKGTYTVEYK